MKLRDKRHLTKRKCKCCEDFNTKCEEINEQKVPIVLLEKLPITFINQILGIKEECPTEVVNEPVLNEPPIENLETSTKKKFYNGTTNVAHAFIKQETDNIDISSSDIIINETSEIIETLDADKLKIKEETTILPNNEIHFQNSLQSQTYTKYPSENNLTEIIEPEIEEIDDILTKDEPLPLKQEILNLPIEYIDTFDQEKSICQSINIETDVENKLNREENLYTNNIQINFSEKNIQNLDKINSKKSLVENNTEVLLKNSLTFSSGKKVNINNETVMVIDKSSCLVQELLNECTDNIDPNIKKTKISLLTNKKKDNQLNLKGQQNEIESEQNVCNVINCDRNDSSSIIENITGNKKFSKSDVSLATNNQMEIKRDIMNIAMDHTYHKEEIELDDRLNETINVIQQVDTSIYNLKREKFVKKLLCLKNVNKETIDDNIAEIINDIDEIIVDASMTNIRTADSSISGPKLISIDKQTSSKNFIENQNDAHETNEVYNKKHDITFTKNIEEKPLECENLICDTPPELIYASTLNNKIENNTSETNSIHKIAMFDDDCLYEKSSSSDINQIKVGNPLNLDELSDDHSHMMGVSELLYIGSSDDEDLSVNIKTEYDYSTESPSLLPLSNQNKETSLMCTKCKKTYASEGKLAKHLKRCNSQINYKCSICNLTVKYKHSLKRHIINLHSNLSKHNVELLVADIVQRTEGSPSKPTKCRANAGQIRMPDFITLYCRICRVKYDTLPFTYKKICDVCQTPLVIHCQRCNKFYVTSPHIIRHIKGQCKLSKLKTAKCPLCCYSTCQQGSFNDHVHNEHTLNEPDTIEKCSKCLRVFQGRIPRLKHEKHCGKMADQQCVFCPFKTKHKSVIDVHMRRHAVNNDTPMKVKLVNKKSLEDDINKHILSRCLNCTSECKVKNPNSKCKKCGLSLTFRCKRCNICKCLYYQMRSHVLKNHLEKKYGCSKCGKKYGLAKTLQNHLLICGIKTLLKCKWCYFKTYSSESLEEHNELNHWSEDKRNLLCRKCGKDFKGKTTLERHLEMYCDTEPKFQCDYCSFKTRGKFSLQRHILLQHAKQFTNLLYQCKYCDKQFSHKYIYNAHTENCHLTR